MRRRTVPDGVAIVTQGEPGNEFFVIGAGSAVVEVDEYLVGTAVSGGCFGEKALLRNSARTATVRARGEVELFVLSSEAFLEALTGVGGAAAVGELEVLHRGPARWTRRGRVEILSRVSLFAHLDAASLSRIADRAVIERWATGSHLITQGEEGDRFFVVLEGRARVVRDGAIVAELRPGDQVGEIALLYGVARTADVVADEAVVTLSLYREEFDAAVQDSIVRG